MTAKPKLLSTNQIRQAFIDFFVSKGHQPVPSSSLVPFNDPTLLFTNAGMNQFKDTFLGLEQRDYRRAVSAQKCVRAGGKHNDLDNVGYTARHHTFFEMLGNFSFGDYFKKEAIIFAWEFLTSKAWLALPAERLYVTVYHNDDDAFDIWHDTIGLSADRIIRIGDNKGGRYQSDNFWMMGDTGPCGPCTEIFYDHGDHIWGGLPGSSEEDGDRFIEIWNCVFMQFNRKKDGSMEALPAPSVDTGMGLERIAAVLQGVHSNYEIDTFAKLIQAAADILAVENTGQASLKVIADHIRAAAFLIADGVHPSNEGRGYVLRRIIRRAVRHGNKLGATESFFYRLVPALAKEMGQAYPQLYEQLPIIESALRKEEEQFAKTLSQGLRLLDQELSLLQPGDILAGEVAFKLYDTYGFPPDLTADIVRERDIKLDETGFDTHMNEQRRRAKDAGKFSADYSGMIKTDRASDFFGYDQNQLDSQIIALYTNSAQVSTLSEGQSGMVVLSATPFYAEGGGQVGEIGEIQSASGVFIVEDTQKVGQTIVHHGRVSMGDLHANSTCTATVCATVRQDSAKNHSATHLLHAALRQILGTGVAQKGSLVSAQLLRFDFSYNQAISAAQLDEIERLVNFYVQQNSPISQEMMPIAEAKSRGAMALFGEKYGDTVRVLTMGQNASGGSFSVELCGGIHVQRTGNIGLFKLISESSIAAGIRRIEALTGQHAITYIQAGERQLTQLAAHFKAKRPDISERVFTLEQKLKHSEKYSERLQQQLAHFSAKQLLEQRQTINHTALLIAQVDNYDSKSLRLLSDDIKSHMSDGVLVLAGVQDGKIAIIASVGQSLHSTIKAGDIVKALAQRLGGQGGGKADFAQGGAQDCNQLSQALADLKTQLIDALGELA